MVNSGKSSLIDKYDLQIDQLDYKYIGNCKNVKVLENILTVLRSGEEGLYPDLTDFCEKRLKELAPNSELLAPVRQLLSYSDLPENERNEIGKDMECWEKEFKNEEKQDKSFRMTRDVPPVRKMSAKTEVTDKENKPPKKEKAKARRCAPRSYSDWDKFNVEEDIDETDENDNQEQIKKVDKGCSELPKMICVSELSEKERQYIADLEKIKGNEAFKVRDYEEAVLYYTRSLSAFKTATTLNNRAQAYIKMMNYFAAVQDCTEVISMEPNNIKALYRRGIAYKESGIYQLAKLDFKNILELDPENKLAKDQLRQIKQLNSNKTMKKKVVIEELNTENKINETGNEPNRDKEDETEASTRLAIREVGDDNSLILSDLNDSNDEDDLPQLPTKVKQMFTVNVNGSKKTKMPNMKEKEIENIFQSKSSNNNKHNMIEECQDIPAKPNVTAHNFNNHSDKQKNEFVNIKIEECNKNEDVLKVNGNYSKQIKVSNINKTEYTSECQTFAKDDQCNMIQGCHEVSSKSNRKEENTNEPLNKLKNDVESNKNDKSFHRNKNNNLNFGDYEIQSNDHTTNTTEKKSTINDKCIHIQTSEEMKNFNQAQELGNSMDYYEKCTKQNGLNEISKIVEKSKIYPNLFGDSMEKNVTLSKEDSYENITPYEFLCTWQSRNTSDGRIGSEYLLKIKPKELPKLISNSLDGSLLYGILTAIYHMYEMGKYEDGENYLYYLNQTPRIKIVSMLLSEEEIQGIQHLFSKLDGKQSTHTAYVNKILQT